MTNKKKNKVMSWNKLLHNKNQILETNLTLPWAAK